jgi:hypothetical protein
MDNKRHHNGNYPAGKRCCGVNYYSREMAIKQMTKSKRNGEKRMVQDPFRLKLMGHQDAHKYKAQQHRMSRNSMDEMDRKKQIKKYGS